MRVVNVEGSMLGKSLRKNGSVNSAAGTMMKNEKGTRRKRSLAVVFKIRLSRRVRVFPKNAVRDWQRIEFEPRSALKINLVAVHMLRPKYLKPSQVCQRPCLMAPVRK